MNRLARFAPALVAITASLLLACSGSASSDPADAAPAPPGTGAKGGDSDAATGSGEAAADDAGSDAGDVPSSEDAGAAADAGSAPDAADAGPAPDWFCNTATQVTTYQTPFCVSDGASVCLTQSGVQTCHPAGTVACSDSSGNMDLSDAGAPICPTQGTAAPCGATSGAFYTRCFVWDPTGTATGGGWIQGTTVYQ